MPRYASRRLSPPRIARDAGQTPSNRAFPLFILAFIAATLAACETPERAPPPDIVIPSGPPAESARPPRPEPPTRPLLPAPHPEVQQFLPGPPADAIGRGPAPVPRPSPVAT